VSGGWHLLCPPRLLSLHSRTLHPSSQSTGVNIRQSIETLQNDKPHIVVGTPGRILDLSNRGALDLSKVPLRTISPPSGRSHVMADQTLRDGRVRSHARRALDEKRCPGDLQSHPTREASDDVLRHPRQRDPPCLSQILPRCGCSLLAISPGHPHPPRSPWRSSSMTTPSSPFTACNNITSTLRSLRR
jgi:hypothetical protein